MTLEYYKSESSVTPELIDTTSSKKYTYLRKDVKEVEKEDPDGSKYTIFEYDECKLTKEDYALYMVEQTTGDAYTQAQLAIADLAETQENDKSELQEAIAELAEIVSTATE